MFFTEKRIDKKLEQLGFTKVPKNWINDFTSIGKKYEEASHVLRTLGLEYNNLLEDYAKLAPIEELKRQLGSIGIEELSTEQSELIKLYIDVFKVEFEDDSTEVITEKEVKVAKSKPKSKTPATEKKSNKKKD